MFTGIVETIGTVKEITQEGDNLNILMESSIAPELKIDQSIAHNGICLTVVWQNTLHYKVVAVKETIEKTNLGNWKKSSLINLERALKLGERLDGHMVQGHVDQTGIIKEIVSHKGSAKFIFEFEERDFAPVEKGSICVNGISLTCFDVGKGTFSVEIIPYTFKHTNLKKAKVGDRVNLEFDMIGKYLVSYLQKVKSD